MTLGLLLVVFLHLAGLVVLAFVGINTHRIMRNQDKAELALAEMPAGLEAHGLTVIHGVVVNEQG